MTPSGNGEEPLKSMMDLNRSHRKSDWGVVGWRWEGQESLLLMELELCAERVSEDA